MTDITTLIQALRSYEQADERGVMVLVSRQACDEAADLLERIFADQLRHEHRQRHIESLYAALPKSS